MSYGYFYNPAKIVYGRNYGQLPAIARAPFTALEAAGLGIEAGDYVKAIAYGVVLGGLVGSLMGKSKKQRMGARVTGAALGAGLSFLYVKDLAEVGEEAAVEAVLDNNAVAGW